MEAVRVLCEKVSGEVVELSEVLPSTHRFGAQRRASPPLAAPTEIQAYAICHSLTCKGQLLEDTQTVSSWWEKGDLHLTHGDVSPFNVKMSLYSIPFSSLLFDSIIHYIRSTICYCLLCNMSYSTMSLATHEDLAVLHRPSARSPKGPLLPEHGGEDLVEHRRPWPHASSRPSVPGVFRHEQATGAQPNPAYSFGLEIVGDALLLI